MARNIEQTTGSVNNIGVSTKITGDVETNSDIRIDGQLVGNIKCSGKIVLGKTGMIQGNITSKVVEISGEVKGNIVAEDTLTFKSKSKVVGDVKTNIFVVEPEAIFTGKCDMIKDSNTATIIDKKKQLN